METETSAPTERSPNGRREEDRAAAEYIMSTLRWVQRGPRILVLLFGLMGGAAGTGAWIGTQASDVTQADIARVNARLDSLQLAFNAAELDRKAAQQDVNEKFDLLLRLGCPKVTRADLVRACRSIGIP